MRHAFTRARVSGAACPAGAAAARASAHGSGSIRRRPRAPAPARPAPCCRPGRRGRRSSSCRRRPGRRGAARARRRPTSRVERRAHRCVGAGHGAREVAAARLVVHDAPVDLDPPDADAAVVGRVERHVLAAALPAAAGGRERAPHAVEPRRRRVVQVAPARCAAPRTRGARRAGSARRRSAPAPGSAAWTGRAAPSCIQRSNELRQSAPHQSQRSFVASWMPASQPGLLVIRTSKSAPVIVVPGGASNRSAAAVPAVRDPDPARCEPSAPRRSADAGSRSRRRGTPCTPSRTATAPTPPTRRSRIRSRT